MTDYLSHWASKSALILTAVIIFFYTLYRRALPKPYRGIPYNEESARRLTGDGPNIMELAKAGKRPRDFWANLCVQKNSPITQFFPGPFFNPIVVLSDYREVQDLLVRRSKETDRAYLSKMMWSGVGSHHFVAMDSQDPKFPIAKQLVRDIMGPAYLSTVSTPAAYSNVLNLIEMWRYKSQIANGRPFKAIDDLNFLTADTIFESAMGITGKDKNLVRNFERLKSVDFSSDATSGHYLEGVFPFPDYEPEGLLDTITVIAEVTGNFPTAPIIQLFWPINNLRPKVRKAQRDKELIIRTQIDRAVQQWKKEGQPKPMTNALEYIISREFAAAKKADRAPDFHTKLFHDALYGYCFGGQDTTHSALAFLVKHFGTYQRVQSTLREALRKTHAAAFAENRNPTPEEINKAQIHYLDAFMEEVLRLNASASAVLKEALADMEVLGCHVPKGAQLLIPLWGPSINQPAIPVPESVRSQSSRDYKGAMAADWQGTEFPPGEFHPERWLRKDADTDQLVFDSKAGPQMTFSLGPSECWGKRLAYLQVRLLTTLLVWNFEFNPLPGAMDNWDTIDILNAKPKVCLVSLKPMQ